MKKFLHFYFVFLFLSLQLSAQSGGNDASFNIPDIGYGYGDGLSNYGLAMTVQPDNKIIVGGNYQIANSHNRNYLARYDASGILDTTFMQAGTGFNGQVAAVALQADGKVIVGGGF